MQQILPLMREASADIFRVPIFEGTVNTLSKTFLERICWTLAGARMSPAEVRQEEEGGGDSQQRADRSSASTVLR